MTREEAIQEFQNVKDLVKQDGKDWFDERDLELINMAIEALSAEAVQGVGRYEKAMQKLREMPRYLNGVKAKQIKKISADAVEVVRCKDCRWWQDDYMGTWCSRLSGLSGTVADFFCAYGERREP